MKKSITGKKAILANGNSVFLGKKGKSYYVVFTAKRDATQTAPAAGHRMHQIDGEWYADTTIKIGPDALAALSAMIYELGIDVGPHVDGWQE